MKDLVKKISKAASLLLILPIRLYQKLISPLFPARCRYYPSCSAYAVESLRTHGVFGGTLLAVWRVLRCNPWSRGGVDKVPDKISADYFRDTFHRDFSKDRPRKNG